MSQLKLDNTLLQKRISKRLLPLYIATFLNCLIFWYAIEKLFLTSIGFDTQSIALVTIVYTVVMLLANIPAGILADRWSRKGVLVISVIALIISCLVGGLSHSFWVYAISASLWGLNYACYVGADQSIVYDLLVEETGNADLYQKYYGRLQVIAGSGLVVSSLVSTLLTRNFALSTVYFFSIPFLLLSLVVLSRFQEPRLHRAEVATLMGAHTKATFKALIHTRTVYYAIAGIILVSVVSRLLYDFDQLWLIALALPLTLFGPVNALLLSSTGVAGLLTGKLSKKKWLTTLLIILITVSSLGLLVHSNVVVVLGATVLLTSLLLLEVSLGKLLHDALPSKVRAGSSSVVSTAGYIAFIPVALLFGFVGKRFDIFSAAWIVIGLSVLVCVCVWQAFHLTEKH